MSLACEIGGTDDASESRGEFDVTVGVSSPSEWELVYFDVAFSGRPQVLPEIGGAAGQPLTELPSPPDAHLGRLAPADPPLPSWCGPLRRDLAPACRAEARLQPSSGSSDLRPGSPQSLREPGGHEPRHDPPAARGSSGEQEHRTSLAAHEADVCRPCIFAYHDVCDKGSDCSHCHFRHSARQLRRANPSQVKRNNVRRRVASRGAPSSDLPDILGEGDFDDHTGSRQGPSQSDALRDLRHT
mmetsp:Transcript_49527/g.139403  ORF Transcript_49527/g.139403 Transcript_49527/m.139403 type:complete len:242 (+) Transcript_49527:106-831(+)